jgi:hypothetical protein
VLELEKRRARLPGGSSVAPTVEQYYRNWDILLLAYDRDQAEHSHPGFGPHAHSYIKLIARRPEGTR